MSDTVTITLEEYEDLVDNSNILQCLEAAGIDNSEAYSHGMQEYYKQKAEENNE